MSVSENSSRVPGSMVNRRRVEKRGGLIADRHDLRPGLPNQLFYRESESVSGGSLALVATTARMVRMSGKMPQIV